MSYRYTSLTGAVDDKQSPLRQFLRRRFPETRTLQAEYRAHDGSLLVEGGAANAGTLGAAFDYVLRYRLEPSSEAPLAVKMFAQSTRQANAVSEVIASAQQAAREGESGRAQLYRACWALALCTEVYRVGRIRPDSPLRPLVTEDRFSCADLLDLAPGDALRQLTALAALANTNLLPQLNPPFRLAPTFDGSRFCKADADLIANGLLLEIKTHLGPKSKATGARSDSLNLTGLYQLLAYVLFDHSDAYQITRIGFYSARYGALATWPLRDALNLLAGSQVHCSWPRSSLERVRL